MAPTRSRTPPFTNASLPNDQPVVIHAPGKNRDVDGVQQFFDTFANRMESGDVPVENMDLASFAKMFVIFRYPPGSSPPPLFPSIDTGPCIPH